MWNLTCVRRLPRIAGILALGALGAGCSASTTADMGGGDAAAPPDLEPPAAACAPKASCQAADKACLGLVDNTGLTKFSLRMSQMEITAPAALSSGIVRATVVDSVTPNNKPCNLSGTATFSWLLQFDTASATLKTGGAKPVMDATQGYAFDDEMIAQGAKTFHVQPISYQSIKPDASGSFAVTKGQDLVMPVFLNDTGTSVLLLPLHEARITMGTLSRNQNCIGTYNAAGLEPVNSCQPDGTHPQFLSGGKLDGYITLEEADTVVVSAISQSLCVLLSGNAAMYGMTPNGANTAVCKRDEGGKILYQGNWCATTNMAAAGGCADAEPLTANFAASSIKINN